MNEPAQTPACSRCGAPLRAEALKGLCPKCLLELNLAPQTELTGNTTTPGGRQVTEPARLPLPSLQELARLFPQLEIIECLGHGGMGAVYKARQPKLDRFVALKILLRRREDGTADAGFAERFAREARALARLNHPEIVAVYDYGEVAGFPYLVMEYVDGLTLRQLIQGKKLSSEEALAIVPKICEALQFAHQRGIVHRDIKPENILLDKEGRVKIADFGIAKILAPGAQDLSLTGGKDVVGTPHYMAPEQVEQPAKVDHRADIFSLGVVFYEMLTGELPLGKFQPPSQKVQVDVRLDEVVLHALEKEPERRYQHASEVKSDVETIAARPQPPSAGDVRNRAARLKRAMYTGLAMGFASACFVISALVNASSHQLLPVLLDLVAAAGFLWAGWIIWNTAKRRVGAPPSTPAGTPSHPKTEEPGQQYWILLPRWTARILGVLWILMYLVFVVGEGSPPLGKQPPVVQIEFVAVGVMLAGMLAGWWREGLGALLGLAGWMLFHAAETQVRPFSLFHVPAVAAVLFGVVWALRLPSGRLLKAAVVGLIAWPFVFGLARNAVTRHSAAAELTTIAGVVSDAQTGQPIAGARVDDNRYGASPTTPPRYTYSLTNGAYELKTAYEEHTIAASAQGYRRELNLLLTKPFRFESRVQMNFRLQPETNAIPQVLPNSVPGPGVSGNSGTNPDWARALVLFNDIEDIGHEFDAAYTARNRAAAQTCTRRLATLLTNFNAAVRGTGYEFPLETLLGVQKIRTALDEQSWSEVERAAAKQPEIESAFQRISKRMVEIAKEQHLGSALRTNRW
jgi:tRNA A-37 threonylcarbamoyl transferase component Bud32